MAGKRLQGAQNRAKLNAMQLAFCDAILSPEVFTFTEAARRAKYKDPVNQGSRLFANPKVQKEIQRRLNAVRLTPTAADLKLALQLEATETKFFALDGTVTDQREVIAWDIRDRALDKLLKLQGRYKLPSLEVSGEVTINVVDGLKTLLHARRTLSTALPTTNGHAATPDHGHAHG